MNELISPPAAQRLCPDCKVELERTVSGFKIYEQPGSLFSDSFQMDIYTCPRCGLVRFYSFDQRIAQEKATRETAQPAPPPPREQPKDAPAGDPWEKNKGGLFGRFKSKD